MNNQHMKYSWFIYFKYGNQFKFPNWFQEWWNCLNQAKNTFTGQSIYRPKIVHFLDFFTELFLQARSIYWNSITSSELQD
ncbi:hypothetical protein Gotur_009490 [Gossypium turneri]